ncbi:aldo/keto reductase [Dictyobacter kobayashii]|uniref:Oxidoreductase n=1 Tax=Dictyobacter kobayashii TaxID=2014872 RepID=A0A402AGN6_9CHLR|nr:aldo/keto reductase [Dictyobacter kobayashii]GCE18224.1 oxidoreductase [Dictyobacter kobayashii]
MERRQFGKTDMQVSVLGFGGAEIGSNTTPADVERILSSALDAGLNVIDTAECYGDSEELIGRAVSTRRDDYYLFTKCGHAAGEELPDYPDWDPRLLEASIDRSLRRLRTDHLDLLQLHTCPLEVLRQGDVINVLQKAKRMGKTRYIGYSGTNENARYAIRTDAFDTLQTSLNIADQQTIDFTLPMAIERNMGVIAKRPIANAAWNNPDIAKNDYGYPYWERLQHLKYDFLQSGPATAFATALRFTLSVPGVHTAIVGTTHPERYAKNAALIAAGNLSDEEYQEIRAIWEQRADQHWLGQE